MHSWQDAELEADRRAFQARLTAVEMHEEAMALQRMVVDAERVALAADRADLNTDRIQLELHREETSFGNHDSVLLLARCVVGEAQRVESEKVRFCAGEAAAVAARCAETVRCGRSATGAASRAP